MNPASRPAQYLTFLLAGEEYAIDLLRVREIIAYVPVTRVPQSAAVVRGIVNHRGTVVPVLDLGAPLGIPAAAVTPQTCILLVEVPSDEGLNLLGIMADSVHQVVELAPGDIKPPPSFGTLLRPDCLLGLGTGPDRGATGDKFILILDLDRVLASPAAPPADGA